MKINLKLALALLISSMAFNIALGQKKDTVNVGTATGLLRDSVHNYVLQSATLSVYKVAGNELVSYQLSNNFGRYTITKLPVGVPLRIMATHVGYNAAKAIFTISPKTKIIDLKTLNLERVDLSLKEVTITAEVAPMQMHGDTLEFNAAAFKLDTNAVVEDLLNKLPGVTVWADGVITVNGKKINRLLVEGKDFFGGDNKIALQNIPKNSVKKIQVYQNKDDPDPMNPKTDMNIVLKKDKKDGYFGKFGVGYGTQQHYAGDGMITYFSPKTQFSLVGAANNVNKKATNVNTLMGFNSFKGEGLNSDYHNDFRQEGKNTFKGTGFTASHDFNKDGDTRQIYNRTNILKGEAFVNDDTNETLSQSQTVVTLDDKNKLFQAQTNNRTSDNFGQRSNVSYDKGFKNYERLSVSFNENTSHGNSLSTSTSSSVNDLTGASSLSLTSRNATSSQSSYSGTARGNFTRRWDNAKQKFKGIDVDINYNFDISNSTSNSKQITDFTASDATQNKYFNRLYQTDNNYSRHTIGITFNDPLVYLRKKFSNPFIRTNITNTLAIYDYHDNVNVGDLTSATGTTYTNNTGLTNISHYKTVDEKPGISFSKYGFKSLDNRYQKYWSASITATGQIYSQRNSALQSFQNLERTWQYFIPSASMAYNNQQYGEFRKEYSLSYNTNAQFPTVSQLAPLNDNSNVYNITVGNPTLKPSYNHNFNFRYSYSDEKNKNPLNGSVNISAGFVEHNITDSSATDGLGRTMRRYINGNGSKFINYNGSLNKAFKFGDQQFQFNGNSATGYTRYNSIVNSRTYDAHNSSLSASAVLIYSYKSTWSGGVGQYFSGDKTTQVGLTTNTYYTWTTNFGFAFAFPRSIFFNTRVNFNNSKSSAVKDNVYYTIWNADLGYRFLKGAEAEIKLSALDLLHQNKAIYNYAGNNSITTSTANVLQQYFMLTLAYYPRKFGLKK
ncbi:MAG: outer membrane beta-barrel protein [Mucilaginibacter sp.]|nr:outer membrane beta-barrel protein [Mucilaginibacter sp.]